MALRHSTKEIRTPLRIVNIKLRSKSRKGGEAYAEIIQRLYEQNEIVRVRGNYAIILRTQFTKGEGKEKIIYGKINRFTYLEGIDWLDYKNKEVVQHELPENLFPNSSETDYFFIPEAHRFAIIDKPGTVSLINAEEFLRVGLQQVILQNEQIEVSSEKDINSFDEIISANKLQRIDIKITYDNQDTNDETTEWMEQQLREMQAGKFILTVVPDHNGELNPNAKVLKGAIGVAESDGEAKATIIDEEGKKKTVKTSNYPLKINVYSPDEDSIKFSIYQKIMNLFREN